ncbi:MAG: ATP-binding protein [Nanoarchaeota archaeon]|nr:ATP-binding protein [Nanoarchaeota archaeon]
MNMEENENIIEYLDAAPSKKIISNKANTAHFEEAMCEIIDNAIDHWSETHHLKDLVFKTNIKKDMVEISWNMGIPNDRLEPLVKMGQALHQDPYSIGTWGEGAKIAMFSIGKDIRIYTRIGNCTKKVAIPKNWLDIPSWDIPVTIEIKTKIPENSTTIEIRELSPRLKKTPPKISNVLKHIAETYGTRIIEDAEHGHKIKIDINGTPVIPISYISKEYIEENFAFIPGFEPTEHIFGEIDGVNVRMIIGILAEQNKSEYGVYLYGNGRMFASKIRDETVGFGTRANSVIPMNHPHGMRLQAHIFFNGQPENIPWQAPLKHGFNTRSELAAYVPGWVSEYGGTLVRYVKGTSSAEILPYSKKWSTFSTDKKIEKLYGKGADRRRLSKEEKLQEFKKAPGIIRNGIKTYIGTMDVWDHSLAEDRPPNNKAKFNTAIVKEIIKFAKSQRDDSKNMGAIEINKKIMELAGEKTTLQLSDTLSEMSKTSKPENETMPISIRLPITQINKLRTATGTDRTTDVLTKIITTYEMVQNLKKHKIFKDMETSELEDEHFIRKIYNVLDGAKQ